MPEEDLIVIIGGGAAGFFAALSCKEHHPESRVIIVEKSRKPLAKVRISGGGRCNVTHACFSPRELISYYPRGSKELLGPFHRFGPKETIDWFAKRGVLLKTEEDGRMFPITDSSETILDCFFSQVEKEGVELLLQEGVENLKKEGGRFSLSLHSGREMSARAVILATGSSSKGWELACDLGHTITPPVPSLFTFNIPTSPLLSLSGISVEEVEVFFSKEKKMRGPLLLTHWGFSGPAVLKLSAFEARNLHALDYHTTVYLNWAPSYKLMQLEEKLFSLKKSHPQATLSAHCPIALPKNLWRALLLHWGIAHDQKIISLADKILRKVASRAILDPYTIEGKTTYKQEFVTCGGVALSEVDFQTMESRLIPHLYFAGEVLDIDGVTGGFNFQNAWTTGWIAGQVHKKKTCEETPFTT